MRIEFAHFDGATMGTTAPRILKKAVNVSINIEIVTEAKAAGLNLSVVLENALRTELKAHRELQWRAENKSAIAESNAELERVGLWSDGYRVW